MQPKVGNKAKKMKNLIKFNTVNHEFVIYWKKWHRTGAVIFLPSTCTWQWRIPPLSQSSERLNSVWRCFQQRIHTQTSNWPQAQQRQSLQGEIELETALYVPANMGWSTEGGASGRTFKLAFFSRKLSLFILLAFIKNSSKRICSNNLKSILTIYFLYWWMRELICDFWPSKLISLPVPSRYPTRQALVIAQNRWWALERSVCSDERPSPVTKSGKKLQMRRYCVAHVMLIILGPTQHAINHHF